MPRELSKISVEPLRRSARIRAANAAGLDHVINLVTDEEEENTSNVRTRVPMPIVVSNSRKSTVRRSGGIKKEFVEDNATVDETDDASTEQTKSNTNPMKCDNCERESRKENSEGELNLVDQLQKDESQNVLSVILKSEPGSSGYHQNVNAGSQLSSSTEATPKAERHSLIRTMGNASLLRQDCTRNRHGNLGEKEGPVLRLRQTPAQSLLGEYQGVPLLQPPTISEMLIPRNIQNPNPFEQKQIDLLSQEKDKHLRRSASPEWSREPSEAGETSVASTSTTRSFECNEVPLKRCRRNDECGPLQTPRMIASPSTCRFDDRPENNRPGCSYWYDQCTSSSATSGTGSGSYRSSSSSVLSEDINNQFAPMTKSCAKMESVPKPQVKVKKSKSRTVCRSCGGIGHRNIMDDHLKDAISRKLAKFGLPNGGRFYP